MEWFAIWLLLRDKREPDDDEALAVAVAFAVGSVIALLMVIAIWSVIT